MLRDVFYYGKKPNVHPREKFAKNLQDARKKATTPDFWIINEFCDYSDFDWEFDFELLPDEDVWAEDHNNVWPSIYQKDSGTWICSKKASDIIIYRNDVDPLKRKKELSENWKIYKEVDETKFDFGWHPDPTDPPYIYVWGNQWVPGIIESTVEYVVPGAVSKKYMSNAAILKAHDNWVILHDIDKNSFDFSWIPDPREPDYIYVFGNQHYDAKQMPTIEYHCTGATERKYITDGSFKARLASKPERFQHLENSYLEDYTWVPDPGSPPYIYAFGNQWNKPEDKISVQYVVPGATEYKYMDIRAIRRPDKSQWIIPDNVDISDFDFSWEPSPKEPPFIYYFATQWQKTGGPRYVVDGANEAKYMDIQKVKALPTIDNWTIPKNIDVTGFDFSWHPDDLSPPYIYVFSTQWALTGGPVYTVPGASEKKYVEHPSAIALVDKTNWDIPKYIDSESFDFSWHPFSEDDPCIYQIGTQWQKTGGPRYLTPGTDEFSPVKYIDRRIIKSKRLPNKSKFKLLHPIIEEDFDFSWHPDATEEPYIYVFGNQHYSAEKMPTVEYHVEGATQYKYVNDIKAILAPTKNNWDIKIPILETAWDFTWVPDPGDPPYVYVFGNQWNSAEIESTIEYIVPGATERKYITDVVAKVLPDMSNWKLNYQIYRKEFDFSWRPSPKDPAYIYLFGNNLYPAEVDSTVEYHTPGATQVKYMNTQVARLYPDKTNWEIPKNLDVSNFDFSWHPNPGNPPYIYHFGTQWQRTGGPRYIVKGAKEIAYQDFQKAVATPDRDNKCWVIPENLDISEFDFSWHPDITDKPYIYQFGTQWAMSGGPKYVVEGATEIKYIENPIAKAAVNMTNWEIPDDIDVDSFDFSWHPYAEDIPYIYQFGTQHQKTGGPRYITPGTDEMSATKYIDTRIIKAKKLPHKDRFEIVEGVKVKDFDYSWHPDETDNPYIYVFGNHLYPAEVMPSVRYVVPGATKIKYIHSVKATLDVSKNNWYIPKNIDVKNFDFSWVPNPTDPAYIYEFGTQHQKTGGPRYIVEGATEIKYVDSMRVTRLPKKSEHWVVEEGIKIKDFDYSWHPDSTEDPYIYVFGNTLHPAEVMPTIKYVVPGATAIKYINDIKATLGINMSNWKIPANVDVSNFDFSWVPNPHDPPFIYEFGTQWQKTDGPQYIVPGASEKKYIEGSLAKKLPDKSKFEIVEGFEVNDFDYSWHPDNTEEPYIYVFGNQHHNAEIMPTVRYVMESATKIKYVNEVKAIIAGKKDNWIIPDNLDTTEFDFSWIPNPYDAPYVYQFGTQWQKTDGPRYVVEGGTEIKYIEGSKAKRLPDKNMFKAYPGMQIASFDFSWHPDSTEQPYIYVFGNEQYDAVTMPTLQYIVPGASEKKYINDVKAKLVANKDNWKELLPIDIERFDFSWLPDPNSPPYIYVFGNQWNSAEKEPTLEYIVPGASEKKYVNDIKAYVKPDKSRFTILRDIEEDKFDFSWRPDPYDDPYIYVFGNQHYSAEKMPTVLYKVKDASERKYINNIKATLAQQYNNFRQIIPVEKSGFDFSWVPDPDEIPYIYVFGNQWNDAEIEPTLEYHSPDASQVKYMKAKATVKADKSRFKQLLDVESFDYSWRPNPKDPPYIYVFGNQWHKAEVEPTLEYIVEGATDKKYVKELVATGSPDMNKWVIPEGVDVSDFDFSWRPDPGSPAYIYQFGTLLDDNDGPLYKTEKNNGETVRLLRVSKKVGTKTEIVPKYYITTNLADLAAEHTTEVFWALRQNIDYSKFDFDWRPNIEQARYVHVFGSPESEMTQTYFVSGPMYGEGNKDFNFIQQEAKAESEYLAELFVQQDMFFVDKGNNEAKDRFEFLKSKFPNIQKTRFLNSWVDTINRCINRSNTELCWILNSELDYTNFDFKYYPNQWQLKMVHVFGTQWSHWGTTYMVNRETFTEDTKYIKIIEHLSNLNFVKDRRAIATNNLYDIVLIDHGNKETLDVQSLLEYKAQGKSVKTVKYDDSYLKTIKNIVDDIVPKKEHYIWICSSVCDYTQFDFSYICDPFARDNLHVFPSQNQKFGDTFLVDVNKTKELINDLQDLRLYNKVNYNQHQKLKRYVPPTIISHGDSHVEAAKRDFDYPYAIFVTDDNKDIKVTDTDVMSLWSQGTKEIIQTTTGGTRIIVPKEAKDHIKTQLYDYPYIKTASKLVDSKPLDIVYLSNGEKDADINYEHLLAVTAGLKNRVVRVDGVQGRVAAYHAALKASDTPWAFTVFAKLKVNPKFDWGWQPDRLQMPKHYIFHAKNPVNGLEYGHQGMIAYNKQLVFNNFGDGLDFTLDDPHETIELLSGIANFNTDAFSTWRTAFREVIKLKSDYTDISQERLQVWLTKAKGKFAKDCLQGANDAVEYYSEVSGDIEKLKLSYEWDWLQQYYNRKYK